MTILELVNEINSLSDENEEIADVISWINDAIAYINVELGAKFPYFSVSDTEQEPPFPEHWQRLLLIPFAVGRTKQKDSSQFEYSDAYSEFFENLMKMKSQYEVPEEYRDSTIKGRVTDSLVYNLPFIYRGW